MISHLCDRCSHRLVIRLHDLHLRPHASLIVRSYQTVLFAQLFNRHNGLGLYYCVDTTNCKCKCVIQTWKHSSKMPSARLPTVRASQWRSLNMSGEGETGPGGSLYSEDNYWNQQKLKGRAKTRTFIYYTELWYKISQPGLAWVFWGFFWGFFLRILLGYQDMNKITVCFSANVHFYNLLTGCVNIG